MKKKQVLKKIMDSSRFFIAIILVLPILLVTILVSISSGTINYSKFISLISSVFKYTEFVDKNTKCKKENKKSKKNNRRKKKKKVKKDNTKIKRPVNNMTGLRK